MNIFNLLRGPVLHNIPRSILDAFINAFSHSHSNKEDDIIYRIRYNYSGWSNFEETAFFDSLKSITDNFDFPDCEKYIKFSEANCFYADEYENYVFAVQPPIFIQTNENTELHSTKNPAVIFRDNNSYYFINGRNIPKNIFVKSSSLTQDDFIKEKNAEYKAAWYEILGEGKMMELLGAKWGKRID